MLTSGTKKRRMKPCAQVALFVQKDLAAFVTHIHRGISSSSLAADSAGTGYEWQPNLQRNQSVFTACKKAKGNRHLEIGQGEKIVYASVLIATAFLCIAPCSTQGTHNLKIVPMHLQPICTPVACLLLASCGFQASRWCDLKRPKVKSHSISCHSLIGVPWDILKIKSVHGMERRARSKWGAHIWERQRVHQRCWIRRFQFPACEWGISAAHANHSTALFRRKISRNHPAESGKFAILDGKETVSER